MGKAWSTRKLKSSTSEILGAHWSLLCEGLDVKKMVKSFEAEIITKNREENPGLAKRVLEVLEEPTKEKQVRRLIYDVLPELEPNALYSFFNALYSNQPQFAHDLKLSIKSKLKFVGKVFH